MPTYKLTSEYEYEIEADSKEEAFERWYNNIEEELASKNTTPAGKFGESLIAHRIDEHNIPISLSYPVAKDRVDEFGIEGTKILLQDILHRYFNNEHLDDKLMKQYSKYAND